MKDKESWKAWNLRRVDIAAHRASRVERCSHEERHKYDVQTQPYFIEPLIAYCSMCDMSFIPAGEDDNGKTIWKVWADDHDIPRIARSALE